MEVSQAKLDEAIADVKSQFDQLVTRRTEEIEKGKIINQNIALLDQELARLQGEDRFAKKMQGNGDKSKEPELVIPSKKKSKK